MRSETERHATAEKAQKIGYVAPPIALEPAGLMGEDRRWNDLCDWFIEQGLDWHDAILVYISERFDDPIPKVYAAIDSWTKSRFNHYERLADPEFEPNHN